MGGNMRSIKHQFDIIMSACLSVLLLLSLSNTLSFAEELGGELKLQKKKEATLDETLNWMKKTVEENYIDSYKYASSSRNCNKETVTFQFRNCETTDHCEIAVYFRLNGFQSDFQGTFLKDVSSVTLQNSEPAGYNYVNIVSRKPYEGLTCESTDDGGWRPASDKSCTPLKRNEFHCKNTASSSMQIKLPVDIAERFQKAIEHAVKITRKNVAQDSKEPF